jgi:hypothetical protein
MTVMQEKVGIPVTGNISHVSWFGSVYVALDKNPGNVGFGHTYVDFLRTPKKGLLAELFGLHNNPKVGDKVSGLLNPKYGQTSLECFDDEGDNRSGASLINPQLVS